MDEDKVHWLIEKDVRAQNELQHHEGEFRAMRRDSDACPEEVRACLTKQRNHIKMLESEKARLTARLGEMKSRSRLNDLSKTVKRVKDQVADRQTTAKEIELKKIELKDLEKQIHFVDKKIIKILDASKGANLEYSKEGKADETLEIRLHVESTKFNELNRINENLRREAQNLLHDRSRFKRLMKITSKKLDTGKKIICDLLEQSNIAYNQRVDAKNKLFALREKARNDLLNNCSAMQKLERQIDKSLTMNDFLDKKSIKRISVMVEREMDAKAEAEWQEKRDFYEKYTKVVNDIKEKFMEDNLDHLVTQFMKLEEDNYNIYSFINGLNKKLNSMRVEVEELQRAITARRKQNNANSQIFNEELESLEMKVEMKRVELETARERLEISQDHVKQILQGIQGIFRIVNVDTTSILQRLGNNVSVTPVNVMRYCELLEGRLKELAVVAAIHAPKSRKALERGLASFSRKKFGPSTILPGQPCPLCAEVRDISEVDESVAVPLEFEEARRDLKEVLRRGSRAEIVHTVAECRLPQSRRIMQRRDK